MLKLYLEEYSLMRVVRKSWRGVILGSGAFLLVGCASVSVVSIQENRENSPGTNIDGVSFTIEDFGGVPQKKNGTLYLCRDSGLIYGRGEESTEAGRKTAQHLRRKLSREGLVEAQDGGQLEIIGQFIDEREGSMVARTLFGMGIGASFVEGRMLVYNRAKSAKVPWLIVVARGGSGREPGLAFSLAPGLGGYGLLNLISAGAAVAAHSPKGIGQDSLRMAESLSRTILWAADKKRPKPKLSGVAKIELPGTNWEIPVSRAGRVGLHPETEYLD